jgi:hypothetical protein
MTANAVKAFLKLGREGQEVRRFFMAEGFDYSDLRNEIKNNSRS